MPRLGLSLISRLYLFYLLSRLSFPFIPAFFPSFFFTFRFPLGEKDRKKGEKAGIRKDDAEEDRFRDEERRLMHLVPAPAVSLMKRRVLSRPGPQ